MTTAERLRYEIDRGLTGDKVPFPDPAAAPLGTDDEAAGTPPTAYDVEVARRTESGGDPRRATAVTHEDARRYDGGLGAGAALNPTARRRHRAGRRVGFALLGVVAAGALLSIGAMLVP